MIAEVPGFVTDVATIAGSVAAVGAACAILSKARPIRWAVVKLVAEPMSTWFRAEVREVVNEELDRRPLTNGWGTRAVAAIADATGADVEDPHAVPRTRVGD